MVMPTLPFNNELTQNEPHLFKDGNNLTRMGPMRRCYKKKSRQRIQETKGRLGISKGKNLCPAGEKLWKNIFAKNIQKM